MEAVNVSGESTKAFQDSNKSPYTTVYTFYSDASPRRIYINAISNEPEEEEGAFLVEEQSAPEAETSCFEEPDSLPDLPFLTPAPIF